MEPMLKSEDRLKKGRLTGLLMFKKLIPENMMYTVESTISQPTENYHNCRAVLNGMINEASQQEHPVRKNCYSIK